MLSKDYKVTCFIHTVLQLLKPIYREGEEIERCTWSHFEAFVFMYMHLEYRVVVKPVVSSARIAKLLVSYRPLFNFIDTVLQLLKPIYREGEEIERCTWSHFEAFVFMYVHLEYRAVVNPVGSSARIAKLLVSYTPFFNF